jgi:hypothetical protein
MNTERKLEIQKLAQESLNAIGEIPYVYLNSLKSSMELTYYLKQITTRIEIVANLKWKT